MIITDHIEGPLELNNQQYGLGYYTDKRTKRVYFYSSYNVVRLSYPTPHTHMIYRFEVNQVPLKWEYIGEVDFEMRNVCVSPCGQYFWSCERSPHWFSVPNQQTVFRQVDIVTLKTVNFEVYGLTRDVELNIRSAHFRHTNHGTFIFFYVFIRTETTFSNIDLVYHLNIDETHQCVHLTPITFPVLLTGDFISAKRVDGMRLEKYWQLGLVELQNELYFYRFDYDGEIFFINWNSSKSSGNWEKFSIDGDYEPKAWNGDLHVLANSRRFYLSDGLFYQRNWQEEDMIFYRLDIQPEIRHCKCFELFRTSHWFYYKQTAFLVPKEKEGSLTFLFHEPSPYDLRPPSYVLVTVNDIPQLKHLAYWVIRRNIERKVRNSKTLKFLRLGLQIAKLCSSQSEESLNSDEEYYDPNWPSTYKFLHVDQQKVIKRVGRGPIIHLLRKTVDPNRRPIR